MVLDHLDRHRSVHAACWLIFPKVGVDAVKTASIFFARFYPRGRIDKRRPVTLNDGAHGTAGEALVHFRTVIASLAAKGVSAGVLTSTSRCRRTDSGCVHERAHHWCLAGGVLRRSGGSAGMAAVIVGFIEADHDVLVGRSSLREGLIGEGASVTGG